MMRSERNGMKTSSLKEYLSVTFLLPLIIVLAVRIPLRYIIGDEGNGFFGIAMEICIILAGSISYGLCEAVAALVRYRVRREQYKNAQKVMRKSLLLGGIIGLILTLILGLFGNVIADQLLKTPLSGLSIRMMAPSILFFILIGIFRGYFQGNGSRVPTMHSRVVFVIVYSLGSLVGGAVFYHYGQKVSALLLKDDYACAYGAMGASIGLLAAAVLGFFHMLILYLAYESSMKRQNGREIQRNIDTSTHIFRMLSGSGTAFFLIWIVFSCLPLLDQLLLFHMKTSMEAIETAWGIYYGRCAVIIGLPALIINIFFKVPIRRIAQSQDKLDYRLARERLAILIHQCATFTIPTATFIAVLAENFEELIWNQKSLQAAKWIQLGSIMLILIAFVVLFTGLLFRSKKHILVLLIGAGALIAHIVVTFMLLTNTKLGMSALIIGNIVYFAVIAVAGFLIVSKLFQYRQEWMHTFVITILAAAISGVIAMLLNKVFAPMLGNIASLLICLPIACIIYIILLVVGRGFSEDEMEDMSGGKILLLLSEWFHIL